MATQVEHWTLAQLVPYANNARTHSDAQVAQIAASIVEFGFTNPCLVSRDGTLIAGHGRVLAARKLGMHEVPVLVLDHLSPLQRRALVLADNRIAEAAGWDEKLLRLELQALDAEGFDLDLAGFDAEALEDLLEDEGSGAEADEGQDDVPELPPRSVSRLGDVWLLGEHRVVCGDSTTLEAYEQLMLGKKARMVFTDPPYNVDYSGKNKTGGGRIMNDALGSRYGNFIRDALRLVLAHCSGAVYVAMSFSELETVKAAFQDAGGYWSNFLIWAKDQFALGAADYQRQYEPILYGWPQGAKRHWCGDRDQSDVWHVKRNARNDLHPTMKPVDLVERAVRNSSQPGDVVLDAFGGSGSTLIAAEKAGRVARLIELDPRFADVIVRRWEEFSGGTAVRESDGASFGELAELE